MPTCTACVQRRLVESTGSSRRTAALLVAVMAVVVLSRPTAQAGARLEDSAFSAETWAQVGTRGAFSGEYWSGFTSFGSSSTWSVEDATDGLTSRVSVDDSHDTSVSFAWNDLRSIEARGLLTNVISGDPGGPSASADSNSTLTIEWTVTGCSYRFHLLAELAAPRSGIADGSVSMALVEIDGGGVVAASAGEQRRMISEDGDLPPGRYRFIIESAKSLENAADVTDASAETEWQVTLTLEPLYETAVLGDIAGTLGVGDDLCGYSMEAPELPSAEMRHLDVF